MRPATLKKSLVRLGARRPHGDWLRYMSGCGCMLCRAANARYETGRAHERRADSWKRILRLSNSVM